MGKGRRVRSKRTGTRRATTLSMIQQDRRGDQKKWWVPESICRSFPAAVRKRLSMQQPHSHGIVTRQADKGSKIEGHSAPPRHPTHLKGLARFPADLE